MPTKRDYMRVCPTVRIPDAEVLSLHFVRRRKSRSILNCTVVGGDGFTPYFHIMTWSDLLQPFTVTVFRTNEGRSIATVHECPTGWVYPVMPGKQISTSGESMFTCPNSCRIMYAYEKSYIWAPQSSFMYSWDPSMAAEDVPDLLARIEKNERGVTLEIMLEAVNRGLLEMAIVATVVFQSGRRIN
ncbi:hypothetical protein B0H14DRAFT_3854904 [Mycena olivaceomarginata]|nr:hypothetical protein B0H14DRAFT_3854904 [Mycena olivaceomarginata]